MYITILNENVNNDLTIQKILALLKNFCDPVKRTINTTVKQIKDFCNKNNIEHKIVFKNYKHVLIINTNNKQHIDNIKKILSYNKYSLLTEEKQDSFNIILNNYTSVNIQPKNVEQIIKIFILYLNKLNIDKDIQDFNCWLNVSYDFTPDILVRLSELHVADKSEQNAFSICFDYKNIKIDILTNNNTKTLNGNYNHTLSQILEEIN